MTFSVESVYNRVLSRAVRGSRHPAMRRVVPKIWSRQRSFACGAVMVLATFSPWAPLADARADDSALAITVDEARERCVTERVLRARIAHYSRRAEAAAGFEVRVQSCCGAAEFLVVRDARVLARRQFDALPSACDDRRDTFALAIALAIENAVAELAAEAMESAVGQAEAAPQPSPVDAASSAAAFAAEQTTAARVAQQAKPARPEAAPPTETASRAAQEVAAEAQPEPNDDGQVDEAEAPEPVSVAAPGEGGGSRVFLRAGARYVLQVLPIPALVFAAGAELPVVGHFKFSLSGLVSSAARTEFATGQLRTQLLGAEALGCGVFGLSFLGIQGCAGLAGGTVRASGLGYDENSDVFLAWAAGVLRISLDLPRTAPVGARLFVDGFVNLVRPEPSVVGGTSAALVTARLGVALGLELAVMWP